MKDKELRQKVITAVCFKPGISGHLEQFERIEQLIFDAIAADRAERVKATGGLHEFTYEWYCRLNRLHTDWPTYEAFDLQFKNVIAQATSARLDEFVEAVGTKRLSIKSSRGEPAHDVIHWADIRTLLQQFKEEE